MSITLVAAADLGRVIGKDNRLPWRLSADLKRFRLLTTGKGVIMGRLTFESIGRALPKRTNVVLSHDPNFRPDGCALASSLEQALSLASAVHPEVMVIGGAQIYQATIALADRIVLTIIHGNFDGDAHFPVVGNNSWVVVEQTQFSDGGHTATLFDLRRSPDAAHDQRGPAFVWPTS